MVHIILRNGKRLQYNSGEKIGIEDGAIAVRTSGDTPFLVARIPMDIVERAEFGAPCRVARVKMKKSGGDY